jgi:phosphatidylinositol-3-phosphatase
MRLRAALLCAVTLGAAAAAPTAGAANPPPIKHVFVLVLENENYDSIFGPQSKAPYLAKTLPSRGELLTHYYGIGHQSLDNYIAMISGQAPNPQTQADCQFFTDFTPGVIGADGQAMGSGCVYPAAVKTVADQLTAKHLTWGGYMEDMGNNPTEAQTCRHPAIDQRDDTQSAHKGDQYAARHNPFVYFHSLIDTNACQNNDVPLDRLGAAINADDVPNFTFITPNLCHDGHDSPCVDGQPGGLVSVNTFLQQWIPMLQGSRAYRDGGLIVVTFDESGSGADGCCVEDAPNTPNAGATTQGPGGGRVGAVLLSPYIKAGTVDNTPYNHYSLLRSVENIFGLSPLGLAAKATGFGADVYNGPTCFDHPLPKGSGPLAHGTLVSAVSRAGLKLRITLAHSALVVVRARVGKKTRRVLDRRGQACDALSATLPRGARSATVIAGVGKRTERRSVRVA